MSLRQFYIFSAFEDAGPLVTCLVEETIDPVVSNVGVQRLTKFDDLVFPIF